jgi:tetratricopeptide (TPR) repeat protein
LAYNRAFLIVSYWPPPDAQRAYDWFAHRFPNDPHRHVLRAKVLERYGKLSESLEAYEAHMSEIIPENETVAAMAKILVSLGRLPEAETMLQRSVGPHTEAVFFDVHPPETAKEVERMGDSMRACGSRDLAIANAKVKAFRRLNHPQEIKTVLAAYLEIDPRNEWALLMMGLAEEQLGKHVEARERVKAVFGQNRRNLVAARFLLTSYLRTWNMIGYITVIVLFVVGNHRRPTS